MFFDKTLERMLVSRVYSLVFFTVVTIHLTNSVMHSWPNQAPVLLIPVVGCDRDDCSSMLMMKTLNPETDQPIPINATSLASILY